jgi:hypothetical protein
VSNILHADNYDQQPSVEGRAEMSLLGDPVPPHRLHASVTGGSGSRVTLDMGSAAGFDIGSEFTAIDAGASGEKTVLEIQRIDGPLSADARITSGPAVVKVGQTFELTRQTYPRAARMVVFASKSDPDPKASAAKVRSLFPGLNWVEDATEKPVDFLVADAGQGWIAYSKTGQAIAPGSGVKGAAFLLLGPPASLRTAIEQRPPFQRNAISFGAQIADANYLLAVRFRSGLPEYSLLDPVVLTDPENAWVRSPEADSSDMAVSAETPDVVCRNDISLPVRTAWLAEQTGNRDALVAVLSRRMIRLGRLRQWLQAQTLAPGASGWPYHLAITDAERQAPISAPLQPGDHYQVRLVTTAAERAANPPVPKYVYLFGFDCAGNVFLRYPRKGETGDATMPQPGLDGVYPLSLPVGRVEGVSNPVGADTFILLATTEKLINTSALTDDGEIENPIKRGSGSRFDELIVEMNEGATRGFNNVPTNWLVQQLVVASRP